MKKLFTLTLEAKVFEDGMLGIKLPVDLPPGAYAAVVVLDPEQPPAAAASVSGDPIEPLAAYVERARKEHIQRALDACGGNRSQAARVLGVDARTVFRFLADE